MPVSKVLIVGAGPSGLLLGLLLSRAGIPVELVEQTYELDTNPRAAHYAPPSVFEMTRAGVIDDIRKQGFMPDSVSWRKLDEQKTRIATIGQWARGETGEGLDEKMRMVVLPLHKLGKVLETHLKAQPNAEIRYGYKVVAVGQDGEKAWVEVETPEGMKTVSGDYVVGCDGANSKVRKCLFGEDVYPGYTWDRQIVATNTYYDFSPYDYDDSQFFIHPDLYHMVAKIQPDGLYRITYGEIGGLTTEQLKERQPKKFEEMLPGHPKPDQYRIVNISPYKIHQRCVDHMRVGRILLAADAAHLCNPL
jgi:2-polyprenyl-6-methoxyphenol hydroxylase-like FAD-dependent oxidoreductase